MSMFDAEFINTLADALAPRVAESIKAQLETPKVAPRYLDLEAAAVYLSTTPDGVRGMARAKRFPVSKIGGRIMFDRAEIDKAMAENKTYLN
jgi:hypothetical protein